jgi:hypothetical protein
VKILYILQPDDQYKFQLGDFGPSSSAISAEASCGSPLIWLMKCSMVGLRYPMRILGRILSWTLNVGEFRQRCDQSQSFKDARKEALLAASNSKIREIAIVDPEKRTSATQMLSKRYNWQ